MSPKDVVRGELAISQSRERCRRTSLACPPHVELLVQASFEGSEFGLLAGLEPGEEPPAVPALRPGHPLGRWHDLASVPLEERAVPDIGDRLALLGDQRDVHRGMSRKKTGNSTACVRVASSAIGVRREEKSKE